MLAVLATSQAADSELVVRVDDRLSRSLTQPYVVVGADESFVYVQALDDGADAKDRYAGDRIFVARLAVPRGVPLEIRLTDRFPQAEAIEVRELTLRSDKELTLVLQAPDTPSVGVEVAHRPPTVESGRSIQAVRLTPKMGAWPSGGAPALAALGALVLLLGSTSSRLVRRTEDELLALAALLRSLRRQ